MADPKGLVSRVYYVDVGQNAQGFAALPDFYCAHLPIHELFCLHAHVFCQAQHIVQRFFYFVLVLRNAFNGQAAR